MRIFLAFVVLTLAACASKPVTNGIPNFYRVDQESVYRGGQPDSAGMSYLKTMGIKTIVDLNDDDEAYKQEAAEAKALGIQHIYVPLNGGILRPKPVDIARIEAAIKDPTLRPIFVHCLHGEDRTGLAIGLYRLSEGWTKAAAHKEMFDLGYHSILIGLETYFWDQAN